jgi:hypothetical protein
MVLSSSLVGVLLGDSQQNRRLWLCLAVKPSILLLQLLPVKQFG